jgi:hypothetical protein
VSWKTAWSYAVSDGVPRRSLWVALVVGTILNLINQGDTLVSGQRVDFAKLTLTYIVPYVVSGRCRFACMQGETAATRLN